MLFATRIIVSNSKFSMLSTQVERATIVRKPEQIAFFNFGHIHQYPKVAPLLKKIKGGESWYLSRKFYLRRNSNNILAHAETGSTMCVVP